MPRVTITNRQDSAFVLPPPVARRLGVRGQVTVNLSTNDLEAPALTSLVRQRLITITTVDDPNTPDSLEGANRQQVDDIQSAIGSPVSITQAVTTTDATPTALLTVPVPVASVIQVHARIVARDQAGSNAASYIRVATFRNDGGTVTQVGATVTPVTNEDTSAWDATITVSGTNAVINGVGAASTTIHWLAGATVLTVS